MRDVPLLPLAEDQVDVWLVSYQEINDEGVLARMHALMNEAECARQARFHFAVDRKRYLVTRAAVRAVLSYYAAVPPAAWNFATNDHGRPFIDHPVHGSLRFNVSHTAGLIALAVARGRDVGIDVEETAPRAAHQEIAAHVFAPAELAALMALPAARQHDRFFAYWTLKEAYIKARGMGLALPLDGFSFSFTAPDTVRFATAPALADPPERWDFWQYRPGPRHLLALCAERRAAPARIVLRALVPTVGFTGRDLAPVTRSLRDSPP